MLTTSEVYQDLSIYDLAVILFEDARLQIGDLEWVIDESLNSTIIPWAWFDKTNYMDALRQLAIACMGYAYCDREGRVVLVGPSFTSAAVYSGDFILDYDGVYAITM